MSDVDLALRLPSDPDRLPEVREKMRAWVSELGWQEPRVSELVAAVDEALSNAMRHGYEGRRDGVIEVAGRHVRDDRGAGVEVQVRDFGRAVDPARIRSRPLDEVRPGGLGVHLIRANTCSAEYSCPPGGGMLLVMRKYPGAGSGADRT